LNIRLGPIRLGRKGSLRKQGIPDTFKPEVLEVFQVHGGKLLDALVEECEGETPVEGAAAGEVGLAKAGPEGVVEGTTLGWEAEGLPHGVVSECLANID
jgi:hypothetical protein